MRPLVQARVSRNNIIADNAMKTVLQSLRHCSGSHGITDLIPLLPETFDSFAAEAPQELIGRAPTNTHTDTSTIIFPREP